MSRESFLFFILICGTVLGLAGTDLVLPAIPTLPASLPGSIEQAQLVLAAFVGGTAIGLILFGELGARFDQRWLLLVSFLLYGATSYAATSVATLQQLIFVRALQGLCCSAPAVFAPGIIKAIFSEQGALRAIGFMGSIESLTPALAPVLGVWLLSSFGWKSSFFLTSALALLLAAIWAAVFARVPIVKADINHDGYRPLFQNPEFLKQTLSHSATLGALLIFVFGAPTVIVNSMEGDLSDFIVMQIIGISLFIITANSTHWWVAKYGRDKIIWVGSLLTAIGCLSIFCYALTGINDPRALWVLFIPVNVGLGLRGPPGFHKAIIAAGENDARGSALLILCILGTAAIGTSVTAGFIRDGLTPLSLVASAVAVSSVLFLSLIKSHPRTDELK